MQQARLPPNDPREWLNRAQSSLVKAREGSTFPDVYLEDLCFDAQQAGEKAIKAVLLHLGIRFPYVHDLAQLVTLAEHAGSAREGSCLWSSSRLPTRRIFSHLF